MKNWALNGVRYSFAFSFLLCGLSAVSKKMPLPAPVPKTTGQVSPTEASEFSSQFITRT
jgi:hypothetical protein